MINDMTSKDREAMFRRHSEKIENGQVLSINNLYCYGQVGSSDAYRENFDKIKWDRDGPAKSECMEADSK